MIRTARCVVRELGLSERRLSPGSPIRHGEEGDGFSWQGDSEGDSSEGSSGPGDGSLWEPLLHLCTGAGARWPSGMSKIWPHHREKSGGASPS